jgi:hypothetical protein
VTLEKRRLALDPNTGMWSVMVYQKKTGDPVYCPIPPRRGRHAARCACEPKREYKRDIFFLDRARAPGNSHVKLAAVVRETLQILLENPKTFISEIEASACKSDAIRHAIRQIREAEKAQS